MRKAIVKTGMVVALLIALLVPVGRMLSSGQEASRDAEHMVAPMLELLAMSPTVKAVAPVEPPMEMEALWEIEDTRTQSETPLLLGMRNGAQELGYDKESRTFYCTIGMNTQGEWQGLDLFAQPAMEGENVRVAWIDDYSYDYPEDSVRDGWRYELLAYTDTAYEYIGLVFTGLPIVTIHVQDGTEIGDEYVPGRAAISSAEHEAIDTGMWIHTRGGNYTFDIDKKSFRLEFHTIGENGKDKKLDLGVLGMPEDTDWLLLANNKDPSGINNHLCWELWSDMNREKPALGMLESRLVEVFVGDEYVGLYQIMQRYRLEDEIVRMGGNPQASYVFRLITDFNIVSRPTTKIGTQTIELRHAPKGVSAKKAFEKAEVYTALNQISGEISDEEFVALVEKHIDIEALMNYYVFSQLVDLNNDNIINNLYIWAIPENGEYRYRISPWDLDSGLPVGDPQEDPRLIELNLMMYLPRHILDLDIGNSREIFWDIWNRTVKTFMTEEKIYEWLDGWEMFMNDCGAHYRETERWRGGGYELSLQDIAANLIMGIGKMEEDMAWMWPIEAQE